MRKVKSEALWNQLSEAQRETLDGWLFEENLSYAEALPRAQQELGFKGKASSLKRYYRRREQERRVEELVELQEDVEGIGRTGANTAALRRATMKLVAAQAFLQVRATPEEASKWGPAVKMMMQNDRNQTIREGQRIRQELRAEDQAIRRETIEFYRQKFEFDIVTRAVRALPELQKLAAAMNDPDPRQYGDKQNWGEAREAIFGPEQGGIMLRNPADKPEQQGGALTQFKENMEHHYCPGIDWVSCGMGQCFSAFGAGSGV